MTKRRNFIIGAGLAGLSVAYISGLPIYEKLEIPGGISTSYLISSTSQKLISNYPENGEAYTFEIAGGHWLFGSSNKVIKELSNLIPLKKYKRKSSVYFPSWNLFIPYPIQNNIRYLPSKIVQDVRNDLMHESNNEDIKDDVDTMENWLKRSFGETLCRLFFFPFNNAYTAGLYNVISPDYKNKTPVNKDLIIKGCQSETEFLGYNQSFYYPNFGMKSLITELASKSNISYGKELIKVDLKKRIAFFSDNTKIKYNNMITTIPLNIMLEICGIDLNEAKPPYVSTLVINLACKKGNNCPDDYWLYIPNSKNHFHRIGFYSNVDKKFLPKSMRDDEFVSIYVEKSFCGGDKPSDQEILELETNIVGELLDWKFIEGTYFIDHKWIEISYTWSWLGSTWREDAIKLLKSYSIIPIGRYAEWKFQGMLDVISKGINLGAKFKK